MTKCGIANILLYEKSVLLLQPKILDIEDKFNLR